MTTNSAEECSVAFGVAAKKAFIEHNHSFRDGKAKRPLANADETDALCDT